MSPTPELHLLLSTSELQSVESWLDEFERSWTPGSLAQWDRRLAAESENLRRSALLELVKIDLERRWKSGDQIDLEFYLEAYPLLGTPRTVPLELIRSEIEIRRQFNSPVNSAAYARRFPERSAEISRVVEEVSSNASMADTSRQPADTHDGSGTGGGQRPIPAVLGRYKILKKLGSGAMGSVHLAEDTLLKRPVALKFPHFGDKRHDEMLSRFYREARSAASIDHPHICPIHDIGEIDGLHYISMAYVEGKPLAEYVKPGKPLKQRSVAELVRKLALALQQAHNTSVVHRDLKPANIMIKAGSVPVVMDFGLACSLESSEQSRLTRDGAILGSPAYMSPEQIEGRAGEVGPASDVYSLGVILYELLTGHLPFQGSIAAVIGQILTQPPPRPTEFRADLDLQLEAICLKMLAKSAAERYASMKDVAAALTEYLKTASVMGTEPTSAAAPTASTAKAEANPELESVPAFPELVVEERRPWSRKRAQRTEFNVAAWWNRRRQDPRFWRVAGMLAGLPLLVLSAVVLYVQLGRATVKVEVLSDDPSLKIRVDQRQLAIEFNGAQTTVKPGPHTLFVEREGFQATTREFVLKRGDTEHLRVTIAEGNLIVLTDQEWKSRQTRLENSPRAAPTVADNVSLPTKFKNSLGMEFVLVPKGKSWLGGGGGMPGDKEVDFTEDFYLGKYEVTQEEWEKIAGFNRSHHSRNGGGREAIKNVPDSDLPRFPIENVSWDDAQAFLDRLNARKGETGWVYRLPTEQEWEHACRGGPLSNKAESAFDYYLEQPTNELLPNHANVGHLQRACKVGSYVPNRLGIYDLHGNLNEWCQDSEIAADGVRQGVLRGGGWLHGVTGVRATVRYLSDPSRGWHNIGFRIARVRASKQSLPPVLLREGVDERTRKYTNSLGMEFALVPKGKSWLGGVGGDRLGTMEFEFPYDFYLGVFEVTQEEWEKVTGSTPSNFSRTGAGKEAIKNLPDEDLKRFPVEMVSRDDAQTFIEQLNKRANEVGWTYRLPKESEWEYACREGSMSDRRESRFDFYLDRPRCNNLWPDMANFAPEPGKGLQRSCKVGSYTPNRLGLYDMHGNLWEWCHDTEMSVDGVSRGFARGGSWLGDEYYCHAAERSTSASSTRAPNLGLRLVRVPVGKEPIAPPPGAKLAIQLPRAAWCMDAALTADESHAITVDLEGKVERWNLETGEFELIGKHGTRVDQLSLSRDGRFVATGGSANPGTPIAFRVWDVEKATAIGPPVNLDDGWLDVAFSADDRGLFVAGSSRIRWYRRAATDDNETWTPKDLAKPAAEVPSRAPVVASPTHPHRAYFATPEDPGAIVLWDFEQGKEVLRFGTEPTPIFMGSFAVSADGKRLVLSEPPNLTVWDAQSGQLIQRMTYAPAEQKEPYVGITPNGTYAFVSRSDGVLEEWDVTRSVVTCRIPIDGLAQHKWYYGPHGKRIMKCTSGGLQLWDLPPRAPTLSATTDPDRRVAELVLGTLGGRVSLSFDGQFRQVSEGGTLPDQEFQLIGIDLYLRKNVTDDDAALFGQLRHIQTLRLGGTQLTDRGAESLAGLSTLRMLDVAMTQITDDGLRSLRNLTNLEELHAYILPITDVGLAQLGGMKSLRILYVRDTQVSDAGMDEIVRLKTLEELHVGNTRITDIGIAKIATLPKVKMLHVAAIQFTDEGVRAIASMKSLKHLELHGTSVKDQSLRLLRPLTQLEVIILHDTKITDVGLAELYNFRKLRTVGVQRSRVSEQGIAALRRAIPGCSVD